MKKRRSLITILMVCLISLIGIGYAAITSSLTINGTSNATASDSNFSVVFDTTEDDTVTNCTISSLTETSATVTVDGSKLTKTGDTATATLTINNDSTELGANLVANVTQGSTNFFAVTADLTQSSIAANGTTTVVVTIQLVKTPTETVTDSFTVTITATATVA